MPFVKAQTMSECCFFQQYEMSFIGMEFALLILGFFILLPLMSLGGWALKGLSAIADIFFQGIGNCLGCMFKLSFWIILIFLLLMLAIL